MKKVLVLLTVCCLLSCSNEKSIESRKDLIATNSEIPFPTKSKEDSNDIFIEVEEMPSFPEGEKAMRRFLAANLTYPKAAINANVSGRVTIQFIVEKDGSIETTKVLKGIGFGCDEEVVRVIKSMPKWNPGMQNGKPVRVYINLPIVFTLDK